MSACPCGNQALLGRNSLSLVENDVVITDTENIAIKKDY